jgi:hypothetical protein
MLQIIFSEIEPHILFESTMPELYMACTGGNLSSYATWCLATKTLPTSLAWTNSSVSRLTIYNILGRLRGVKFTIHDDGYVPGQRIDNSGDIGSRRRTSASDP